MKQFIATAFVCCAFFFSFAQTINPYESFGYEPKHSYVMTHPALEVSNSDETASVSRIIIDAANKKAYIYGKDSLLITQVNLSENEIMRFLSVDPLTKKYPMLTPYQFASNQPIWAIDLDGLEAKIKITTEVTGYSVQRLTGIAPVGTNTMVVVPTYKVILTDAQKPDKIVGTASVTRDSWYSRGQNSSGQYELINRHFEPADANKNLYTGERYNYPIPSNLSAYKLTQYGSTTLNAQAHTAEQETFLDGKPIDEARTNYSKASDIYFHISGLYQHTPGPAETLGASYGCFGFVSSPQIYKTVQQANDAIKNGTWADNGTSNEQYNTFLDKISEVRALYKGTDNNKVLIQVIKRDNVKEKSEKKF